MSTPSQFQWDQHHNSSCSTSLTPIRTTKVRTAGSSLTKRRPEDLGCDITTILCWGYRLERDYRRRRYLEAILAAIQEAIQEAIPGVILAAILGAIQGVTLRVILGMGPVQRMETVIHTNQVDHRVDRIQYRAHCGANFEIETTNPAYALPPTPRFLSRRRRHQRCANSGPLEGENHRRAKETISRITHTYAHKEQLPCR
jgi:hypothetical protein